MTESARRFWPPPPTLRFEIEFTDGSRRDMDAVGMARDGEWLLFFSRWPGAGGLPIGNRVPRDRVAAVVMRSG